jgi:hypothetical protein
MHIAYVISLLSFLCIDACVILQETVRAFFGLCYARGLLGANKFDARVLWTGSYYGPVFEATMSVNRKASMLYIVEQEIHILYCMQGCGSGPRIRPLNKYQIGSGSYLVKYRHLGIVPANLKN